MAQYIDAADICIFHNNPPGQHDAYIVGGDEAEDPAAEGAGKSAASTAVAAGLTAGAIGALGGPAVALAAAAGEWRDGDWADFNPVAAPRLMESASN